MAGDRGDMDRFAIIMGAMKAGTSSLFRYLAQHPEVAPSSPKEVHFFSYDTNWAKGPAWYFDRWSGGGERHGVALEASTSYTKRPAYPRTVERLRSFDRDLRFIYQLRDPFQRIESHYRHKLASFHGRDWRTRAARQESVHPHALAVSDYASQLEPYEAAFGRDRILATTLEEMTEDPHGQLARICRFLDIDDGFRFEGLGRIHNASKDRQVIRPAWASLGASPMMNSWLPKVARKARGTLVGPLFWTKRRPRFTLTTSQREHATDALAPGMERLHREYGIDVSRWGF